MNAEDADLGRNGRVKYSIEFGNKDGHFSMDEDTGELTLAKTIPLVENVVREFSLYVAARDGKCEDNSHFSWLRRVLQSLSTY